MSNWPWPLDGVQNWFDDLWNWISEAATNAVRGFVDTIWSHITWLKDRITEVINRVSNWIWDAVGWVKDRIAETIQNVSNWIWDGINWLKDRIVEIVAPVLNAISKIYAWFDQTISSALSWISGKLQGYVEDIKGFFDTILHGALSGVAEALGKGLEGFIKFVIGSLRWITEQIVNLAIGAVSWLKDTFVGFLTDLVNQVREALSPKSPPKDLSEAITGLGKEWLDSVLSQIESAAKSPVSPEEALRVATGIATTGLGVTSLALALGMAADAAHPSKEFGGRDAAKLMLAYLGVDKTITPLIAVPYEIGVLRPLRSYFQSIYLTSIPSVQDLITMSVREVFTRPELQEEFPAEFAKWMKLHGFSEQFSRYYWAMHWKLPSVSQVYEMLHRGIKMPVSVEEFLKYADIAPEWRKPLIELSWSLPGRIDLRWMYEWGQLSFSEMEELLGKLGITEEYRSKVAEAYAKNIWRDYINRIKNLLIRMFKAGKLTKEELVTELKNLGFVEDAVNYTVREAELEKELSKKDTEEEVKIDVLKDEKKSLRSVLTKLLIADKISETEFRTEMKNLGLTDEEIDATLKYVSYYKTLTEKENKEKQLTKSELIKAWEMSYISNDELVNRLKEMGLSEEDAELLADILKANALSGEISLVRNEIINSFIDGFIDEDTLRANLKELGTPDLLIDYYVEKAKIKADREDKNDWITILRTAFRTGKINVTELRTKLSELGLQSWKIETIIAYEEARKRYES